MSRMAAQGAHNGWFLVSERMRQARRRRAGADQGAEAVERIDPASRLLSMGAEGCAGWHGTKTLLRRKPRSADSGAFVIPA